MVERLLHVEMVMGTAVTIDIVDPDDRAPALLADAVAWFHEVDERFSTYKPDSEVCRLDRGEIRLDEASADLRHVVEACETLRVATRGYFDAYAGGRFDPSGYVKGWSVEVASRRLHDGGAPNHCVNAGGDIRVRGRGPDPEGWRLGIRHPWQPDKLAWVVAVTDLGLATSGRYERGGHVVDPFTGRPADELCSVSVLGPDLALADAYATAALAMGRRGIEWLATLDGYESTAITEDAEAYRSGGFPALAADPKR